MKKILPLLLVGALLAGGAYYYQNSRPTNAPQTILEQAGEAAQWAAAIASGKPTLCTMTKDEVSIQYLIYGKKMKSTTISSVGGVKKTYHMINDEQYVYLWDAGEIAGTKTRIFSEEEINPMTTNPDSDESNISKQPSFDSESYFDDLKKTGLDINCVSSVAISADFVPPTNIKFEDLSGSTKALPSPNKAGEYDMKDLEEMAKKYGATMPSTGE